MKPIDAKILATDEGDVWFSVAPNGGAAIGYEAFQTMPHMAILPDALRLQAVTDGVASQARAFDVDAARASMGVAMGHPFDPQWTDHEEFLPEIGFSIERGEGQATFTRYSTEVRKTTITVTQAGHVSCQFHGRFPEDAMEILSIGCAATGEVWPSTLDPVHVRVIMALDLEVEFGAMGYDKGAKARAAMAKAKAKIAQPRRRRS